MIKYRDLLFRLLPSGKLFSRDSKTGISKLLSALAAELGRIETRALKLPLEADPFTALETLDRWESVLSIEAKETVEERRTDITVKFTAYGGQTVAYFVEKCAAIGITVSIDEYPNFEPPAVNGQALTTDQKRHCFRVTLPAAGAIRLRCGMTVGLPLQTFGAGSPIPDLINSIKPAHTYAAFNYI